MGDFDAKDPVRLAYELIIATLKGFAPLTGDAALVKVGLGSIIDLSVEDGGDPRKPRALPGADYPILDLLVGEFEDSYASGTYVIDQAFELMIDTGKVTVGDLLWVLWQVRRALWELKDKTGTGYTWMATVHVRSAEIALEEMRKRVGWTSIARIAVQIAVPSSEMGA